MPRFTLIGATTRPGALPRPLRDRFGLDVQLEPYSTGDLAIVATRSAALLGIPLTADVAAAVAVRSQGTPRLANRILRRLRDFAAHHGADQVDAEIAAAAFGFLEVDADGLDARDRRYLACLRERGRAVGVGTISVSLGEDMQTVEDEIEPWLIASGFVDRTPSGRVLGPRKV